MPQCEICNEPKRTGYRVNPRTGRLELSRFWCDRCYEQVVAASARRAGAHNETHGEAQQVTRGDAPKGKYTLKTRRLPRQLPRGPC